MTRIPPHGAYGRYAHHGCRCDKCRAYQNGRVARNRADRLRDGRISHGTRSAYDAGCRCDDCCESRRAAYPKENAARRGKARAS